MRSGGWGRWPRALGLVLVAGIWLLGCAAPARSGAGAAAPPALGAPSAPGASAPAAAAVTSAAPTAAPSAGGAAFDEKAVGDFYRGKTIRIITGSAPGGT